MIYEDEHVTCHVCDSIKINFEGVLFNGKIVHYCIDCYKSIFEGLKIYKEKTGYLIDPNFSKIKYDELVIEN